MDLPASALWPQGRLRLTEAGLEFTVRSPSELRRASAIDDQVMKAISDAIAREPRLALAGAGAPKLQDAG